LQPLSESIRQSESIVLTGDFNEPSHLDWTDRYAKEGRDRWVKNPTLHALRFAVPWPGSSQLAEIGMIDSYRAVHPDEVQHRGITWTPFYMENTPGRRSYNDQVLDRIDRIYHAGSTLQPIAAAVVGERSEETDLIYPRRWPSDHRAVVVTFRLAGPVQAPEENTGVEK
jgi:exonuclease III